MNCEILIERLDEFVDGDVDEPLRTDLEAHVAVCPECKTRVRSAQALVERLRAMPGEIEPGRELWPEIEARIVTRAGFGRDRRPRPNFPAIAAAAGIVAIGALMTVQMMDAPTTPTGGTTVSNRSTASTGSFEIVVDPGVQLAAQNLFDATQTSPRGGVATETVVSIRENLAALDGMAQELSAALEQDPDNADLQNQLLDIYRMQARLLDYLVRMNARPDMRTDL